MNNCDLACQILQLTEDGDDLIPHHLYILQEAVNGHLNETGQKLFEEIHRNVVSGKYKKPWFHDIKNLTIDNQGYVFWKGKEIEHFNPKWAYSKEAMKSAKELKNRCCHLEKLNVSVNTATVIWNWEKYQTNKEK